MMQINLRSRQARKRLGLAALLLGLIAAVVLVAACTSNKQGPRDNGSSVVAANGNKQALCKFNADLQKAGKSAQSEKDWVALVRSFEPSFDQALADAPADIKRNVEIVIDGLRKIAKAGNTGVIDSSGEAFSEAGNQLDAYCGL